MKIKDFIEMLKKDYDPETEVINILWNEGDIRDCAGEGDNPIALTDRQVKKIMKWLEENHDANIGLNWEQLDYAINNEVYK